MDKRTTKRGGYYWIDNRAYPSVTQIIDGVLSKPALQYWFGQQVYRAFAADPALGEKEALAAPYQVSDKAKARGSAVHSIIEVYKHGIDFETFTSGVLEDYRGYASAFWRWVQDMAPEIQQHERTVFSPKYGYAGTLDMIAKVGKRTLIVDAKTSKDIYPEYWLQVAAYRQALKEEGIEVDGTAILLLTETGGYKWEVSEAFPFREFFACKVLWDFRQAKNGGNGHG